MTSLSIAQIEYAHVVLIAYNRVEHVNQTLEALSLNIDADNTKLYCYIDGPKNIHDAKSQTMIINVIKQYKESFKSVKIIHRKTNYGLAINISEAVTETISKYGKVIVVEDDIITSKSFIKYMNDSLKFYENEKKVWHISAHSEINFKERENEIYLWRLMNCWGWATWKDRWDYYEKNPKSLINEFNSEMVKKFDLNESGIFWSQVIANATQEIDTWAIFWYATIFKHQGLCVSPFYSYSANIGFDGSGVHCGLDEVKQERQILNHHGSFIGKAELIEDNKALQLNEIAYSPKKKRLRYKIKILLKIVFEKLKNNIRN